ncbi:MAG: bifunctional folylpolyglutamate synthase/dihydrofolate synthase [Erysipelotrichaceae bacterium]|nr:bifunctional folylpolyglutamate synthase/dihydrofolate synthase [Erysipelotrichaceae bacterium]
MFNTAHEFIEYCTNRMNKGRFSLEHFKSLLERLDNPQYKLKTVHIAGTNGKGSTTDYLRSIIQTSGYKVGTFTSPHLEVHNDRIRINNQFITDEDLLHYGNRFHDLIEKNELSMFEIDTLIAIYYFIENKVDIALFEVGLGGRLDATNVILPLVSLITSIGYDHMDILGHTLEEISYEKAGIIKQNTPIITAEDKENCLFVFKSVCEERHSELSRIHLPTNVQSNHSITYTYRGLDITLNTLAFYQIKNSSLAIECALYLRECGYLISDESIMNGLRNTQWKGRFETISTKPYVIIDGAHNMHGIDALVESTKLCKKPLVIVFSALKDKETEKMIHALVEIADEVIVTEFEFYRAAPLELLSLNNQVTAIRNPHDAIEYALRKSVDGTCLITGSLYFISEVRQVLLPHILGR